MYDSQLFFRSPNVLDNLSAPRFLARGLELVSGCTASDFFVDFTHTTFISTAGLDALLGILKSLQNRGGKMALVGLSQGTATVFVLTGAIRHFRLFGTLADATASLE